MRVDAIPGDGVCAAAGGACTLRAAVEEANALAGGHAITLPAGTYTLTIAGLSVVTQQRTSRSMVPARRRRSSMRTGSMACSASSGGSLTLNGLTVQHGYASRGAGIYVSGRIGLPFENDYPGVLTLNDTTVTQNVSTGDGGGVYLAFDGSATMNRTTVSGNSAASGGGIYFSAGPCILRTSLSLTDSTIAQNVATGFGGGLYMLGPSCNGEENVRISRSTVSGNSAAEGGGIYSTLPGGWALSTRRSAETPRPPDQAVRSWSIAGRRASTTSRSRLIRRQREAPSRGPDRNEHDHRQEYGRLGELCWRRRDSRFRPQPRVPRCHMRVQPRERSSRGSAARAAGRQRRLHPDARPEERQPRHRRGQ